MVGRFRVEGELGSGAFGTVWLARDERTGAPVALKFLDATGVRAESRFDREFEALARLVHPNIVRVRGSGHWSGRPFIALEFVDGRPLDEWVSGKPDLAAKRAIASQMCAALAYAHSVGVVHRDLKPANILVHASDLPQVKLVDFGISKLWGDQRSITKTGEVIGTAGYMSPEQLHGLPEVGPEADVYALGAVLYAVFEGRPAFRGSSVLEVAMNQLRVGPEPLTVASEPLRDVILRCLAIEPADRPSLGQLSAALEVKRRRGWVLAVAVIMLLSLVIWTVVSDDGPAEITASRDRNPLGERAPAVAATETVAADAAGESDLQTAATGCRASLPAGTHMRTVRAPSPLDPVPSVLVHLPPGHESLGELPVVVLFHSQYESPEQIIGEFVPGADARGFAVIAPDGQSRMWQAWRGEELEAAVVLLAQASDELCLSRDEVFTVGHHLGGFAALRFACTDAVVAGAVSVGYRDQVKSTKAIAVCGSPPPTVIVSYEGEPLDPPEGGRGCGDVFPVSRPAASIEAFHEAEASVRGCTGGRPPDSEATDRCVDWDCDVPLRTCRASGATRWPDRIEQCAAVSSEFDAIAELWSLVDRVHRPEY